MRRVAVALFTLALTIPMFAQKQFSAEFVDSGKETQFNRAKIYVGDHKFRIEPEAARADAMTPTALVLDSTGKNSFAVMDSQKMVIQNLFNGPAGSAFLPEAMATLDLNDPCGSINRWHEEHHHASRDTQLSNCKNLGTEHVNGRTATKWQATNGRGQTGYFWLDPELHFMIKADTADGGHMNLENIKEGTQPASLFEPPAGYRVMTMQQMMQEQMGRR